MNSGHTVRRLPQEVRLRSCQRLAPNGELRFDRPLPSTRSPGLTHHRTCRPSQGRLFYSELLHTQLANTKWKDGGCAIQNQACPRRMRREAHPEQLTAASCAKASVVHPRPSQWRRDALLAEVHCQRLVHPCLFSGTWRTISASVSQAVA